jgi:hypothetical protein
MLALLGIASSSASSLPDMTRIRQPDHFVLRDFVLEYTSGVQQKKPS